MANNKDPTTFEEAPKIKDRNNPMKEEILNGHGRIMLAEQESLTTDAKEKLSWC